MYEYNKFLDDTDIAPVSLRETPDREPWFRFWVILQIHFLLETALLEAQRLATLFSLFVIPSAGG